MKYQRRQISLVRYYRPVVLTVVMLIMAVPGIAAAGGTTYTTDADFDEGVLVGVEHETVHDQLQLSEEKVTLPFIWVPNMQGTVSKVNTETGDELGRYRVVPPGLPENGSPSRTTVDLDGSCWVGNRAAGTVVKIGLYEAGNWIDRNGDSICQTSQDTNGDGDITGDEIFPWGQDECVLYEVVLIPGKEGTYAPGTYAASPLPTWQPSGGVFDGALLFDGGPGHVLDDDARGYLNGLDALTIGAWVKSDATGTDSGFLILEDPTGSDGRNIRYDDWGGMSQRDDVIKCGITSTEGKHEVESSAGAQTTEWQHVAMTWQSGQPVKLYINGQLDDSYTNQPTRGGTLTGYKKLIVGRGGKDTGNTGWDGLIEDVRIYSYALTEAEIGTVMAGGAVAWTRAWNPSPHNGAKDVPIYATLSWMPADTADSHDVYFGTSSPPPFIHNQAATTFDPGPLDTGTTYYWQIVEQPGDHAGPVWSFRTMGPPVAPLGGLQGSYFHWVDPSVGGGGNPGPIDPFQTFVLERIDPEIDFEWDQGSPDPSINVNQFSARWTGEVQAEYNETYTFYTMSDDGVRLWVDGNPIIENWTEHGPTEDSGTIDLVAGQLYDVQMEWYENGGGATAQLLWESSSVSKQIIPQSAFPPPIKASSPSPPDGTKGVPVDATLIWMAGDTADTHDVYFGTSSPPPFIQNQTQTTYDPGLLAGGTTYYWQINECDAEGNGLSGGEGDVWSFTTAREGTGTILREVWRYISGTSVSDLTSNPRYPDNPSFSDELTSFEAPIDWADYYGTRIHGYLHPQTSGNYKFWIASDDASELWLSTDDNPANAVHIANVPGWTSSRQWDKYPTEQQSASIPLTGGNKYYIMALQKEHGGGDHVAVAWQKSDWLTREVISGSYLSPYGPPVPPEPPGLVAHWKFDEAEGTTASDSSGNGNDGTLMPGYDLSLYDNDSWSTSPRGLAIDAQNNLWAGTWASPDSGYCKYYYIDGATGTILKIVDTSAFGHNAYGAVIDKNGILWSSAQEYDHLLRLDPSTDPPTISTLDLNHFSYGIGLDYDDHLFVSGWDEQKLSRIDILTGTGIHEWEKWGPYQARGVACTSLDNHVWVASTYDDSVYRFDNDGILQTSIYVGDGPTGVAVDAEGKVWACNLNDDYIKRINPATNTVDLEKQIVGSGGHYSYSDMTGIIARTITTKTGIWTVVYDGETSDTSWGSISWNSEPQGAEPGGTLIAVAVRSSNDGSTWSASEIAINGVPLSSTPDGQYLEIKTTLRIISGDISPILSDLTVNRRPVAVCQDVTVAADDNCQGIVAPEDVDNGSSDPDGDPITLSLSPSGPYPLGTTTVTLTVTDDQGATDTCSATVTVVDMTPPTISCPADVTLECPGDTSVDATGMATAIDICDSSPAITFGDMIVPGCGNTKVIERTWTATDASGNSESCVQTITVVDTTPPIITCPPTVTLECPADTSVAANGSATATDTCSSVTITHSDAWVPGCGNTGTVTRTWTATDECGNSSSCVQTITVVDTIPPEFTIMPQDMTVQRDGNGNLAELDAWLASVVEADDACGNVTITDDFTTFPYKCGNTGSLTVTWTAEDECGKTATTSATFTIEDPTAAVTYDGDLLLSTEGAATINASLIATLRDDAGNVLDIDGEEVTFTLTAEGVGTIVATALSVDGIAHAVEALEPAIYMIEVSLACSDFTTSAMLVVYNPEGGFATGGGWIVPEDDGLNTHPNARANFGFNAKYKQDAATGHIEFRYSDGHIDLKSSSIEQLVITGGKIVQFKGWASVNKEQGHWFFVKAIDNGEPGINNDTFEIKVWASGVSPEGDPTERAGGVLQGGNIVVHTK